jgi:polysaccharide export outer membrane protein
MATSTLNAALGRIRRTMLVQQHGAMTDGQLLECYVARREEAAFAALVKRHGPMVLGVCRRVLNNFHDAEDAFQATFLVLVRKAASIKPRGQVGNWLYGVARRTALKARGTAARRRSKERQAWGAFRWQTAATEVQEDRFPVLDQEMDWLPEKYRAPLVLCALEGLSRKEAARQLGWSEGTLSGRLARAKDLLATRLARRGLAVSAGMLALGLSCDAASAGVPGGLMEATIRAAMQIAVGPTATAGVISAKVAALTEGVIRAMFLTKVKVAMAALVVVAGIGIGAGQIAYPTLAGEPRPSAPARGEQAKEKGLPSYVIEPPDLLRVEYDFGAAGQKGVVRGEYLVRPDGTIGLGEYGSVTVTGLTLEQAKKAIADSLDKFLKDFDRQSVKVEVLAYNSKVYYVITDGANDTEQVYRFPITGSDTVLDALSQVDGLPQSAARRHVWIARPSQKDGTAKTLPVDWTAITQQGMAATNYQLIPGDRIYVKAEGPTTDAGTQVDRLHAEKDFAIAEFYRRTGHAESAAFYYEKVWRRYPNTTFGKAAEQLRQIKKEAAPPSPSEKDTVVRVGQIFILGNTRTADEVILRELPLYPGAILNHTDVRTAERNLAKLGRFVINREKGIRPTVTVIDPDGESVFKDIVIRVEEK